MQLDSHGSQLVRIHLVYREDEADTLQIFAPLGPNGQICTNEFYGHFRDGGEIYPVIIVDDSIQDSEMRYSIDWGWDEKTECHLSLLPRKLEVGQEVWRQDFVQGEKNKYCYLIKAIKPVPLS